MSENMAEEIMRPSQEALYIFDCRFILRIMNKERELAYPTISILRLWNAVQKDYETTSPRIYVNRRTPSCLHFEFSRFEYTRQKRVASLFPPRVLRMHVSKGSKIDNATAS